MSLSSFDPLDEAGDPQGGLPDQRDLTTHGLRPFALADGTTLREWKSEVEHCWDVLLGRVAPPTDLGVLTLMEVAEAYHARASEITAMIQQAESEGLVAKGSPEYQFRTGPLRTFLEATKRSVDLGSRRITAWRDGAPW